MSFQQISWQFVEGTKSFLVFGNMLEKAMTDANIPLHSRAQSAWESRGFYTKCQKFWVGILPCKRGSAFIRVRPRKARQGKARTPWPIRGNRW